MFIAELLPNAYQGVQQAKDAQSNDDVSLRNVRTFANLIGASFSSGSGALGHLGYSLYDILTLHFSDAYDDLKVSVKSTYNCATLALTGTVSLIVPSVVNLVHYNDQERYDTLMGTLTRDIPRKDIHYDTVGENGNITTHFLRTNVEPKKAAEKLYKAVLSNLTILKPDQHPVDRRRQALDILDQMHQGVCVPATHDIMSQVAGQMVAPTGQTSAWQLKIEDGQMTVQGHYMQIFIDLTKEDQPPAVAYRADFVLHDIGEKTHRCDINCREVGLSVQ